MPELEREEVLAARQEEKAKAAERSTLFAFHKTQQGKEDAEEESGAAKSASFSPHLASSAATSCLCCALSIGGLTTDLCLSLVLSFREIGGCWSNE